MATEKREGFGLAEQAVAKRDPTVYQTPDYRVIIGKLSKGAEGTADELLIRYIIQHKVHGVIYGSAAGYGQAVTHALIAQAELQNAQRIAEEQKARNFEANTGGDQNGNGPSVPRFDS